MVDLPARSFDLARHGVAPPLLKDNKFVQCKVYFSCKMLSQMEAELGILKYETSIIHIDLER